MKTTTLKTLLAIITDEEKDYSLNDYLINFIDQDKLKKCNSTSEVIEYLRWLDDEGAVTNTEVIYYSNAIEYLMQNDQSLTFSLWLAKDYGYGLDDINSELLASLLKTDNNRDDFNSLLNNIESKIDDLFY